MDPEGTERLSRLEQELQKFLCRVERLAASTMALGQKLSRRGEQQQEDEEAKRFAEEEVRRLDVEEARCLAAEEAKRLAAAEEAKRLAEVEAGRISEVWLPRKSFDGQLRN